MAELRGRSRLPMLQRLGKLRSNILIQAASERDVHGLHASTDSQDWYVSGPCQLSHLQLERCASLAHHTELVTLSFAVQFRSEVGTTASEQETVNLGEQTAPGRKVCYEREDNGDRAEVFDGTDVASTQKVSGLAPTPFFPLTGVEVWCHADERFHCSANRLHLRNGSLR